MNANERIAEIKERESKATPGEWNLEKWQAVQKANYEYTYVPRIKSDNGAIVFQTNTRYGEDMFANWEFIAHSRQDIPFLLEQIEELEKAKDTAYSERQKCVAAIARFAIDKKLNTGMGKHPIEDTEWEDDWKNIVYIDLPTGQVSWHIHDSELEMFAFLRKYNGEWDGHTTEEKYKRLMNWRII